MNQLERPEVAISADLAVWLRGPALDTSEDDRKQWAAEALYAVSSDFDLENAEDGVARRAYLARALQAFAQWQTPANITFLRLRSPDDVPVPVGIELYSREDVGDIVAEVEASSTSGDQVAWFAEAQLSPPEQGATVGAVSREPVEEADGWHRLVFWVPSSGDAVESRVRYVRHFAAADVVAVVRWGGLDPAATVDAILDVDALVRGIRIGGES